MPTQPSAPRRGRPPKNSPRAPLSPETIGRAAVDIAALEGFPAVTMRRVAAQLGVTVRALYNVVSGRQDVIDLAVTEIVGRMPDHHYDVQNWRDSIASWYRLARAAYRPLGRALLVSLEETPSASQIPAARILSPERMLAFLVDIGLTPASAADVRGQMLLDVFAFGLLIDLRYDQAPAEVKALVFQPVPKPWLDANPEASAPISRQIADGESPTSDDALQSLIDRTVTYIEALLQQSR